MLGSRLKGLFARDDKKPAGQEAPDRSDTPFRLRPGAAFSLDPLARDRLCAGAPELSFELPSQTLWIQRHGWFVEHGFTVHRFFAAADPRGREAPFILQAIADASGQTLPDEITLFHLGEEVFPGSPDDWAVWLDDTPGACGLIGWPVFECQPTGHLYQRLDDMVRVFRDDVDVEGGAAVPARLHEQLRDETGAIRTARLHRLPYARVAGPEDDSAIEIALPEAVDLGADGAWVRILKGLELGHDDVVLL